MESGKITGTAYRVGASSSRPHEDPQMSEALPEPPPLELMKRRGQGQAGRRVDLLSNH